MTEFEYLSGLVLLLIGFNIGFREAGKGLQINDFKKIFRSLLKKIRKQAA